MTLSAFFILRWRTNVWYLRWYGFSSSTWAALMQSAAQIKRISRLTWIRRLSISSKKCFYLVHLKSFGSFEKLYCKVNNWYFYKRFSSKLVFAWPLNLCAIKSHTTETTIWTASYHKNTLACRGESRAAATCKMERLVIIVNGWKLLAIITKNSILVVAAALDPPLDVLRARMWR